MSDRSSSAGPQDIDQAIRLTAEQEAIVRAGLISGHAKPARRVVKAFAGTGKTSTSRAYALARPKSRILYMAYNRSIRDAAHATFPRNVDCKTAHQLAYAAFGAGFARAGKLSNRFGVGQVFMGAQDIARQILGRSAKHPEVTATLDVLNGYWCSRDAEISMAHLPDSARALLHAHQADVGRVLAFAKRCWVRMCDPADKRLPMTHDGYLKLYQLSAPRLAYDEIIFDEAQDANPVIAEIVRGQSGGLLALGDPHQQIYQFRGAENFLDEFTDAEQFALTESFRFGPEVARMASAFLAAHKLEMQALQSNQPRTVIRRDTTIVPRAAWNDPNAGPVTDFLRRLEGSQVQEAILARGTFQSLLLGLHLHQTPGLRDKRLHFIGGIDGYRVAMALDLWRLSEAPHQIENALIRDLVPLNNSERMGAIREFFGNDAESLAGVIHRFPNFPGLVSDLRDRLVEHRHEADVVVSTIHRAKGLEFPSVRLMAGLDVGGESLPEAEEINICYVGLTRARHALHVSPILHAYHANPGDTVRAVLEARPEKKPVRPHRRLDIHLASPAKATQPPAWQARPSFNKIVARL